MLKLNVSTKFKIAFNSIDSVSLNSIQLTPFIFYSYSNYSNQFGQHYD